MDMVYRVIFSFEVLKLNRIWQKREPFFSNCNSEALNATQLMERDAEGSLNVVMQKQNILYAKASFGFGRNPDRQLNCRIPCVAPSMHPCRGNEKSCIMKAKLPSITKYAGLNFPKNNDAWRIKAVAGENLGELSDEDDDLCPVDCVREFKTDEEFLRILEKAKETDSLVVVDFYRTSCGSCKYIEQGFAKLCKGSGDQDAAVTFLKHNVIDEYDEQSEVAERLRIKTVPLFHFYKKGVLVESFPTRDKERILGAILKYTSPAAQET